MTVLDVVTTSSSISKNPAVRGRQREGLLAEALIDLALMLTKGMQSKEKDIHLL